MITMSHEIPAGDGRTMMSVPIRPRARPTRCARLVASASSTLAITTAHSGVVNSTANTIASDSTVIA